MTTSFRITLAGFPEDIALPNLFSCQKSSAINLLIATHSGVRCEPMTFAISSRINIAIAMLSLEQVRNEKP